MCNSIFIFMFTVFIFFILIKMTRAKKTFASVISDIYILYIHDIVLIIFWHIYSYIAQNGKSTTGGGGGGGEVSRTGSVAYETRRRILLQHFHKVFPLKSLPLFFSFFFFFVGCFRCWFCQSFSSLCFDGHKGHES